MIHEITVDVPARRAYNQWTQFEEFPRFMEHVEHVRQLDDTHLHWKVSIAGATREWQAEITEQSPDQRIAWKATDGTENAGVVSFHPLDDTTTRVTLQMEMDPEGLLENVADKSGFLQNRVKKDLENFKEFIEKMGTETGAWRGEVKRETPGQS